MRMEQNNCTISKNKTEKLAYLCKRHLHFISKLFTKCILCGMTKYTKHDNILTYYLVSYRSNNYNVSHYTDMSLVAKWYLPYYDDKEHQNSFC